MFRLECQFYIPLIPYQAVSIQYSWADNQKCLFFYQSQISSPYCKWRLWGKMCALWDIDSEKFLFGAKASIFPFRTSENFLCGFYIFRGRFKCFVFVQPWNFPPMEEVIFPLYLNGIAHNPIKISWFEQFQKDQLVLTTSAEESVLGCNYIQAQFVSWPHLPSPLGWPMSAMIY